MSNPKMSYREFLSKNKGKYSRDELKQKWYDYKDSTTDNTSSDPTNHLINPPTNHLKNTPSSPKRKKSPRPSPLKNKVNIMEVINVDLDKQYLMEMLTKYTTVSKLVQILTSNKNLEKYLDTQVSFWANVYFLRYGRTLAYRNAVISGNRDPLFWKKMVMDEHDK